MRDFVVKVLTDELVKAFADKDKADSDKYAWKTLWKD